MVIASAKLQNLRLGPVLHAAGFREEGAPRVHAWRTNNHLRIGRHVPGGNRRYDLADAARLFLMYSLSERYTVPAQPAVDLVNQAFEQIEQLAECHYRMIDTGEQIEVKRWAIEVYSTDGSLRPEIELEEVLAQSDAYSDLYIRPPRIRLYRFVEAAREKLASAIGIHELLATLGEPSEAI
jgi:hypothetical protein